MSVEVAEENAFEALDKITGVFVFYFCAAIVAVVFFVLAFLILSFRFYIRFLWTILSRRVIFQLNSLL